MTGAVRPMWGRLAVAVAAMVGLDQGTKLLAELYLRGRGLQTVVEGFLELRYARNPGAFFSLGAELDPTLRRVAFLALTAAASLLIVRLYRRSSPGARLQRGALALLLSGALGNFVDRVARGEVIDFLHLHVAQVLDWATFNVADVYIAFGLGLLAIDLLRAGSGEGGQSPARAEGSG